MTDLRQQLEATLHGAYTLDRELGGGGMSRVFVADELRLGRKVVVKVLSPELAAGISAERFEREIRLAASLQQANIVPVLSAGETDGLPFYTMPYVEGESLRVRLGEPTPLTTVEILRIFGDIARALQYAHSRGIVHRDIKPDNVLLSGGTAVVTDFGIAKALSASRTELGTSITQLGTSIGTPAYMAPEQAAGDPDVDGRADIYALGCLVYELLSGHSPFHGRTAQRVLAAHMAEAPQPLGELRPDLSPALVQLVMRCLEKDPDARPQTAAELSVALDGVTSGGGLPTMPAVLLNGPVAFKRALIVYLISVVGVAVIAKAATVVIGLPEWVFPASLFVMALGLPVILATGYVQSVTRRSLIATPKRTPGGTQSPAGTMATLALKASPHLSWSRARNGGLLALSLFATVIVGFMIMRALGIGPAGSLFAAGRLNARDPIMIADFTVNHADSSVGSVVAEAVRTSLNESSSIVLTSPVSLAGALRRMQRPSNTRIDFPVAKEIAAREGIKAIITGDVTGLGSGYVVGLRLLSADSGVVLASYQTTVNGPADLVAGVDVVARKLRGKIGESLRSVRASPPLERVTTSSLAALRDYSIGVRENDVDRDYPKAVEYLRHAVLVDSNFAMAWRKLSVALANGGFPRSASDSAGTRAHLLVDRLSENERLTTEASYYDRGPGRDRAKAVAAYEDILKRGDSDIALNNLALLLQGRRAFARAESLYRASIRKNPDLAVSYSNLISTLAAQGKIDEIRPLIADVRKRFPTSTLPASLDINASYNAGRFDQLTAMLDTGRRSSDGALKRLATGSSLNFAVLRGKLADARRYVREGIALDSANGVKPVPGIHEYDDIYVDGWFHGPSAALVQRADSLVPLLELTTRPYIDRQYTTAAVAYAMAGAPDKARMMLTRMRSEIKDTSVLRYREELIHGAQATIALSEKHGDEAVSEFRKADVLSDGPANSNPLAIEFNLGRAFDIANKPDSAIVHFERYLNIPYVARLAQDAFNLAGVYKRLGEMYEAKGDRAKAESYLSKFVDLWKDADPELQPKVKDAKDRLARLAASDRRG